MEVRIITKVTHECVEQAPLYRQFIEKNGFFECPEIEEPEWNSRNLCFLLILVLAFF